MKDEGTILVKQVKDVVKHVTKISQEFVLNEHIFLLIEICS
jgi:hypothetical protein